MQLKMKKNKPSFDRNNKKYMLSVKKQKLDQHYFSFSLCEEEKNLASLFFVMDEKEKLITIENLKAEYPGKRFGCFLLYHMCLFLLSDFPHLTWIHLDDCTGISPPKNIYFKLGFQVRDEKENKKFCSWNTWIKKYKKKKQNPSEERRIEVKKLLCHVKKFLQM
jgi:hypothetical protein